MTNACKNGKRNQYPSRTPHHLKLIRHEMRSRTDPSFLSKMCPRKVKLGALITSRVVNIKWENPVQHPATALFVTRIHYVISLPYS